ncbi:MAG: hypothetical protein ACXWDL_02140 [Nocardioides sp.]
MDSPAVVTILLAAFAGLLTLGHRGLRDGLRDGLGDSAAFGAVCLSLATVLGCLLVVILYAETA